MAQMMRWQTILMPGHFAAKRVDRGYAKFIERVRGETMRDRRMFIWLFYAGPAVELALAFVLGAISIRFGLTFLIPMIILAYPVAGVGDMYLWKRKYGRLLKGVGYEASFLGNLDILYLFSLGYLFGWAIL